MKIVAFDPGKIASYAIYDTREPHLIEIGTINLVGSGRLTRPCSLHLTRIAQDADAVVVEEVGARREQGVTSVFTFGLCVGTILGALGSLGVQLVTVTPQSWKSASRLNGLVGEEAKTAARAYATELWPGHEPLLRVKKNHGLAEAALMARWYFNSGPGRDVPIHNDAVMRSGATQKTLAAPKAAKVPRKPRTKKAGPEAGLEAA